MRPVVRRLLFTVGWIVAAVVAVLVSWVAAVVAANLTGVGETAPGIAARTVAAEFDADVVDRIDEGRFCGFPCLVDVFPIGPAYEGSALLHLDDASGDQLAEALTAAGFEPGDGGLDIAAHQRLRRTPSAVEGVPTVWHSRDIAGSHGVVVQIYQLGSFSPSVHFDEGYPPPPARWVAPIVGLTVAAGFAWVAFRFRRR